MENPTILPVGATVRVADVNTVSAREVGKVGTVHASGITTYMVAFPGTEEPCGPFRRGELELVAMG